MGVGPRLPGTWYVASFCYSQTWAHRQPPRTYQVPLLRTTATTMPGIPQRRLCAAAMLTLGNTIYSTPTAVDKLFASHKPNKTISNEEKTRIRYVFIAPSQHTRLSEPTLPTFSPRPRHTSARDATITRGHS